MAPEQAKGKPVDKRADVWAFGVVLFELLTGTRLFSGETASETLALVMTQEPSWEALPAATPARIRHLLRRCLTKDPKQRLRDIGEARIALGQPGEEENIVPVLATPKPLWRQALPWAVAGLLGFALVAVLWTPAAPRRVTRLSAEIGADASLYLGQGPAAILSPDGSTLAFVATATGGQGDRQLFVRRLDRTESAPLSGTEGARNHFFSPDGQWLGFFAEGKLKKIAVTGGAAVTLADAPDDRGGSWSEDGTIVFAPLSFSSGNRDALFRVSAEPGRLNIEINNVRWETGSGWFPNVLRNASHPAKSFQGKTPIGGRGD